MNYENMSKEELVEKLNDLERHRAFTYEDQMKLAILDASPFTIWASDRNCRITLWEGQCEALYGYSHDFAIGKDYITLFVAPDEQTAARRDQIDIIDNAAVFHNIANDSAKNGNTLKLITNCFRIKDLRTGQFWNAEMGLIIDYLEQEKDRLELIVTESRQVKSHINLFIESTRQRKEQFLARKKVIRMAIAESQRKAAEVKKLNTFREKIAPINQRLEELQEDLWSLTEDYCQKIQACILTDSCESIRLEYNEAYDDKLFHIEDILLNLVEINSEFNWDNTMMQSRDNLLKEIALRNSHLSNLSFDLWKQANEEIYEYRKIGDIQETSTRMAALTNRRDTIQSFQDTITNITEKYIERVLKADKNDQLTSLRINFDTEYAQIEKSINRAQKEIEGGV
jgi:PAS domain S-box-containing protein